MEKCGHVRSRAHLGREDNVGWLAQTSPSPLPSAPPLQPASPQDPPSQQRYHQPPRVTSHKYRRHPGTCPLTRPSCHQILLNITRICPLLRPIFAAAAARLPTPPAPPGLPSQAPDSAPAPITLRSWSSRGGLPLCTSESLLKTASQGTAQTLLPDKDSRPQTRSEALFSAS